MKTTILSLLLALLMVAPFEAAQAETREAMEATTLLSSAGRGFIFGSKSPEKRRLQKRKQTLRRRKREFHF